MKTTTSYYQKGKVKISRVEKSQQELTDRAGVAAFARYIEKIGLMDMFKSRLSHLKKNAKGAKVHDILKQIICWIMDGTSTSLGFFDLLARDESYCPVVGSRDLVSSHTAKRLCQAFDDKALEQLHGILDDLFVWRLKVEKPECVVLGLDVMPMDNDEAHAREGVEPTYKKYKGFAPIQMTWNRRIVSCRLRPGSVHSLGDSDAKDMITRAVKLIRSRYNCDVPIVVRLDSGFMSEELFASLEALEVGYLCGGRKYIDIIHYMSCLGDSSWQHYFNPSYSIERGTWKYFEFGDKCQNWSRFRRAIYTRPLNKDGLFQLPVAGACNVIYTNIGRGEKIDQLLKKSGLELLFKPEVLIKTYHDRGSDELVFRAFKELQGERLPFEKLKPNKVIYQLRVLTLLLYEAFKSDITYDVIPVTAYAGTFRRRFIDTAGKLVTHAGSLILKVSHRAWDMMGFARVWERCCRTEKICLA